MAKTTIQVPSEGAPIRIQGEVLVVPDQPIIPFVEGRWDRAGYLARIGARDGCSRR
jgi:hypothetical protein